MEFIVSYWFVLLIIIALMCCGGYIIYTFIKMPTTEQLNKVKEWLLYAVTEAEKELGSGTGQIKLRYVYDMFIAKFPFLTKVVAFDQFSEMVDEVLDKFRELLQQNESLQAYIGESGA